MLRVQLFGAGQAFCGSQPLPDFPNQRCYHLLCYILLNRRYPHHREQLATLFWGEYPSQLARKYLRNALWRLRLALQGAGASLDDYLTIHDDSISFVPSGPYWLDIEVFESTLMGCQSVPGQELTRAQADELQNATELYSGDLLAGIYEDWCLYDRERFGLLHTKALSKLMLFHETAGSYELGLACGERILSRDVTRERVHQQMMRLHWLAGDREAALGQYKRCVQVLRAELGTSPMPATRLLYQQMLRGQFQPVGLDSAQAEPRPRASSAAPEPSTESLTSQILRRLHRLQARAEETRVELNQVEHLISEALLDATEP